MEQIMINKHNLTDEEITDIVKKVKILLINSNDDILLGYSYNNYQFPGGTHEEGEELIDTVNREIEEETGIRLDLKQLEPFAQCCGYYKDWPELGTNKKVEIYYYEILTDELPKLENTRYTESEKEGHFELRYVPLNEVEKELTANVEKHGDKKGIASEMLILLRLYKEKIKKIKD